jgi:hypothetical protein
VLTLAPAPAPGHYSSATARRPRRPPRGRSGSRASVSSPWPRRIAAGRHAEARDPVVDRIEVMNVYNCTRSSVAARHQQCVQRGVARRNAGAALGGHRWRSARNPTSPAPPSREHARRCNRLRHGRPSRPASAALSRCPPPRPRRRGAVA